MNTIPIVFSLDRNVEMPAGVCIESLLLNVGSDTFYDIYILHGPKDNFSHSLLNRLPDIHSNCRLSYINVGDSFSHGFEIRGITIAAYYRLLAPILIPKYDKLIYCDIDMIIRSDLEYIYKTDLSDNYFGAVDISPYLEEKDIKYILETIHLDVNYGYFNSGALLINSAKLREDNMIDKFLERGRNQYTYQDQDIINIICNKKITRLPLSFNLTTYAYYSILTNKSWVFNSEANTALNNGIIHYNGAKPWKEVCPNMDIWWSYYRKSIFYDEEFTHKFWKDQTYRLEKMSLMKRIKLVGRYFRKGGRM